MKSNPGCGSPGWQQIIVPWEEFSRKEIGNGAPNDGLGLKEVHGWAFGMLTSHGELTYYLDDIELYGERDPLANIEVAFTTPEDMVREGGRARLNVSLSIPSEVEVTVDYHVQDGQARVYQDYEPVEGTLVFEPGALTQQIVLQTVEDEKPEPVERLSVVLSHVEGAKLGYVRRLVLKITDDDPAPDGMLLDVEDAQPFDVSGEADVDVRILTPQDPEMMPDQGEYEDVLGVIPTGPEPVKLTHSMPSPQDWSGVEGFGFWYYGTNSGQSVTVELLNNPGVTTADLEPGAWELQWADEFDGPAGALLDPDKWKPEIGDGLLNGITGWGNGELEYYTDEPGNVSLDGEGHLVITARALNEDDDLYCWYGPCGYTSARLITQDRYEFTYGRVEARLDLPEGNGLWPAFWMLGNDINTVSWPACGEVDIMEFVGRIPDTIYGTLHGPGYSGSDGVGAEYVAGSEVSDTFHTYAVEWQPEEIRWYIDDVLFSTVSSEDVSGRWVFDHPFFIIMNLAVGGQWPGSPDESTTFPQELVADYVRVYGAGDSHERFSTSFVDDFNGWQKIILPFSDFSRSANQPLNAPNDGFDLKNIYGFSISLASSDYTYYLDQFQLIQ